MADEEVKAKWGVLQERHRAEIKESRAEVMRLKKSVTQGDKKKKKDITAQIATLESDLADRQAAEERAFKAEHPEVQRCFVSVAFSHSSPSSSSLQSPLPHQRRRRPSHPRKMATRKPRTTRRRPRHRRRKDRA